jgi:glycosidase
MSVENRVVASHNVHGFLPTIGPELSAATLPGDWGDYLIQPMTGVNAIRFSGSADGDDAFCDLDAYHVSLPVRNATTLGYWIYPQQDNATYVAVNLRCTDGSTLRDTMKGESRDLPPARQWSHVSVPLGKKLSGKTVDRIWISYGRTHGGGQFRGYIDDIFIGDASKEPNLRKIARSHAPRHAAWIDRSVIYLVNPRAFSTQGNFHGITASLDRLRNLGVGTLWIMPVMPPGETRAFGSPYCVRDSYAVNPAYGSMADLKALVGAAHSRKLRVILDFPLNHTSWDNALVRQHPDWFRHSDDNLTDPGSISRTLWWSDVAQLDYDNPAVREYMIDMQRFWLKTCDLDGFRYDSAELIPTEFWNELSGSLRKVKPGILLLGESSRPEVTAGAFNLDYSFSLYTTLAAVVEGRQPASAIRETMEWDAARYPAGSLHMRYAENNDTRQAIAEFGKDASHAAAALVFCLDGVPLIQNGQEVGDDTPGSFIDRKPIDWDKANPKIAVFYKELIAARNSHPVLQTGALRWIGNSSPNDVASFTRTGVQGEMLIAINLSRHASSPVLQLPANETWQDVTSVWLPHLRDDRNMSAASLPKLDLAPWSFRIFQREGR